MPINNFTYPPTNQNYNNQWINSISQQSPIQQPAMQTIVLVNSEQEASNWTLAPGNSMFFMNSNEKLFYIKSADFSGMTSFRKFRFEELIDQPEDNSANYVTREEFESLKASMKQQNKSYQKKGERDG